MKNINDEIPFSIPNTWTWCRLNAICNIKGGKRIPKGSTFSKAKTPHIYIRVSDMFNETISDDKLVYIDDNVFQTIKNYIINKDDLYVSIAGSIGKCGIVPEKFDNMNLTENAVKLTNIIYNKFWILTILTSDYGKNKMLEKVHQVAQPKLSITSLSNILIPIPPINEVVKIINTVSAYKEKLLDIERNSVDIKEIISKVKYKILDYYFSENSCYKSYFMNIEKKSLINFIPDNCVGDGDWVLSEDMDVKGEYKLIQLKHIGNNTYLNKSYNSVNHEFVKNNNCSIIESETLLVNRLVSDRMNCCIVPKTDQKHITSVDVCWISKNDILNNEYLMYLLSSPSFQREVMHKCSGSTRKRISKKNLLNIKVNVHEYKYQLIIKDKINYIFKILDSLCV